MKDEQEEKMGDQEAVGVAHDFMCDLEHEGDECNENRKVEKEKEMWMVLKKVLMDEGILAPSKLEKLVPRLVKLFLYGDPGEMKSLWMQEIKDTKTGSEGTSSVTEESSDGS